jgi:hypothetical protein
MKNIWRIVRKGSHFKNVRCSRDSSDAGEETRPFASSSDRNIGKFDLPVTQRIPIIRSPLASLPNLGRSRMEHQESEQPPWATLL